MGPTQFLEIMRRKKELWHNLAVFMGSFLLVVMGMELLFPRILNKIPLSMDPGLDEGLRIFSQNSKKSVVPENYIALLGDSYAQGFGDWLKEEMGKNRYRLTSFDYHSAHVLYRKTGRDVVSFGEGGSGSLGGIAVKPVSRFLYLNSLSGFTLEKPERILVYFYEGNDLDNNIRDIQSQYSGKYKENVLYDPDSFQRFIQDLVERSPLLEEFFPLKNLLFTRFILQGIKNTGEELERGTKRFNNFIKKATGEAEGPPAPLPPPVAEDSPLEAPPPSQEIKNMVRVGGKEMLIPDLLQGPGMELTEEETRLALYVLDQSLFYLKNFFEGVPVGIVYIPSPLSSYPLASPMVSVQSYAKRRDSFDSALVGPRSQEICERVEAMAAAGNMGFLDARKFIRKAAREQLLHGPRDWKHVNKIGYHVLTEGILAAFFDGGSSSNAFGCRG